MKTSIDLVSGNSDRYSLVLPCLPYVDNLIINEVEASALTGIAPKIENLVEIATKLKAYGVQERVIIHTPPKSVFAHLKMAFNSYLPISCLKILS